MTSILEIILNAMFTGIGVMIGTWLTNRLLLSNIEKILEKIREKNHGRRLGARHKNRIG